MVDFPGHTPFAVLLLTTLSTGVEVVTFTVTGTVEEHPAVVVPTTVYVVPVVGLTDMVLVVGPVSQVWEVAPVALSTRVDPVQITGFGGVMMIPGKNVTGTVFVLMHPADPP